MTRVKILGFMVVAETVENQTQETFEDARGEENGPELSGRIGFLCLWIEIIMEDFQQQNTCNTTRTSWREREVIVGLKKEDRRKWQCDLVDAHSDIFWELGDCMGEFPGGRRETNFVVERWSQVSYIVKQFVYESALGIMGGMGLGTWKFWVLYIKSPSFQQQKLK